VQPDSPLTQVHPHETKPQYATEYQPWGLLDTPDTPAARWRHSGWTRTRTAVYDALQLAERKSTALVRFQRCGSDPWVAVDPDDPTRLTILTDHCRSRWCIPCANTRAHTIATNLTRLATDAPARFITLTLRHASTPLPDQLTRLYASFRALRRSKLWARHVSGGAAVLEISFARSSQEWHPHLHVICHGTYIPKEALSAAWLQATGDSFIVDVRLVRDSKQLASYVTKYVTKPIPSAISNDPPRLAELVRACASRRLVLTFGTWRGFRLSESLDTTAWKRIDALDSLIAKADNGYGDAPRLLALLQRTHAPLIAAYPRSPPDYTAAPPRTPPSYGDSRWS